MENGLVQYKGSSHNAIVRGVEEQRTRNKQQKEFIQFYRTRGNRTAFRKPTKSDQTPGEYQMLSGKKRSRSLTMLDVLNLHEDIAFSQFYRLNGSIVQVSGT
jgi:hypothetical protein